MNPSWGTKKTTTTRAACRIDLAGGTLDLWPLYLYMGGLELVNMAINVRASTELSWEAGKAFELTVESRDFDAKARYSSIAELEASLAKDTRSNPLRWVNRMAHHWLSSRDAAGSWHLRTASEAPPGSGLGGSSVLGVSMQLAFADFFGPTKPLPDDEKWRLQQNTRDLEAIEIEHPAGDQDYVPALFGGLLVMHLSAGERRIERLDTEVARWVGDHMGLLYTGKPHHSGLNNWQIFKSLHDGDASVREALRTIGLISKRLATALRARDYAVVPGLINDEWVQRQKLSTSICPPVLDSAWDHARAKGAVARKACGAGGGGCMLFVFASPEAKRAAVAAPVPDASWRWLSTEPALT